MLGGNRMQDIQLDRHQLTFEGLIQAPKDRVWAAITTSEGTRETLFGCSIDSTFEPGARIEFRGQGADGDNTLHVYGFVHLYEPNVEFAYEQHAAPAYDPNHETTYCDMTFKLIPEGEATRLVLTCNWTAGNRGYEHAKASYPQSDYMDAIKRFAEAR